MVWAIARGSDTVSGPLGRGTLEMMLAQPLSRLKYILCKSGLTLVGSVVIASAAWLGMVGGIENTTVKQENQPIKLEIPLIKIEVEIPFTRAPGEPERIPLSDHVDANDMIPPALNLIGLGIFFGGFTTLMSAWDQYRWRTIAIAAGFLVVQMLLRVMSLSMEDVDWLAYTTIFSLYEPEVLVAYAATNPDGVWSFLFERSEGEWHLGGLGYFGLLSGAGLAGFVGAMVIFCRRDLPAPV